ncbi:LacI family transcriptional regulator [Paenibacillus glycanilyticus]|uniref:LacI family transcriptional regulator n=1 Tax=Paenibacillus glycanilyticus TaxID=126569 RepID=A0ABQ6NS14_9BACL|nr:LacI family DNA-binding transcriptional regulator [Paenibacillus glycanilyticus]GMK46845.1 LacI family transcriptional regulator [Paenibacillus glycanilyticus]
MVSIKDIARQAGVSISTVSYALNGNPKVTEETTARILAVASELNYVPNAAARSLKRRETKIIGVFLTDFSGAFYGDLLQGMKEVLSVKGYDLIVCSGKQSHRMLPERLIDGAIILDETFDSKELASYAERGHKLVVLDRELNHANVNQVLLDNKAGAALAIEYLLEQGHRKLYAITGPRGSFDSKQRLAAATQVVERASNASLTVIEGDFNKSSGEHAAARLVAEGIIGSTGEPAAIFCFNDEMAIGMCHYLQRNHPDIVIGRDLHLIGFDNLELASFMHPRLATIDYSKRKWGAIAAEQLLKIICGQEVEQERIYVSLVRGETVGSVAP